MCIPFLNVVAVLISIKISIYMFFGYIYIYIYHHLDGEMSKFTEDMVILQVTVGHYFHNCVLVGRKNGVTSL